MASGLLLADQLTKDYGSFRALDALTLEVQAGEIVGLLGPNGSGKSTALRLFLGFLKATSGRCSVAGFDSWEQSVEVRRRVAYLPSELRLYETMTGRRLIKFLAELRGEKMSDEADRLAKQLDVPLDKALTQLSSGMKRKVALLSALIPKVPLIVLDEPTNALDPSMRGQLLDQLMLAKKRGQAVLFSSHVLAEVEQVCDRVAILRRGQLVHQQPMAELREGRFVRAHFAFPPPTGPDGAAITAKDGVVELEYRGPLPTLLGWLNQHAPKDLRIEPLGLSPLYARIHGG
ncbi:MAG TPA: ABC transporter ATP-binding protein [Gemmataceae bacterium]|jgi:ABC-2 type transport system ATP-binding protein|nr:ABC transporter ATP-binding protein [Gemmataceae bacterium]